MKVAIIGGGPAGLYLAILLRRADPRIGVWVYERNRIEDTFGFGVVLSDATEGILAEADPETHAAMAAAMHRWGDIDVHVGGTVITSGGHGFCGISRRTLLQILSDRARELGVDLKERTEAPPVEKLCAEYDLVVAADGVNSAVREARADRFGTTIDFRPNRFVWLGTSRPFPSFFFSFARNAHGLWRAHAYQYARGESTFIVETTDAAWRSAGLEGADEAGTIAYCEELFRAELEGHSLVANRSIWRQFPTVRNASWSDGNLVLMGDAAHTAHFSVGSGTKLAMEDSIALAALLREGTDIPSVLAAYETERRPAVESLQRAAQASLEWFETTERYSDLEPLQFAYSLLTRSLRITHENLRARDPAFVERVEHWFAEKAEAELGAGRNAEGTGKDGNDGKGGKRSTGTQANQSPAIPHSVPAAGPHPPQSRGRLADVPVHGRGRHPERLAPGASRRACDGRGRARDDRDDRRERGGEDLAGLHGDVGRRAGGGMEADRGVRAPARARDEDRHAARARGPEGRHAIHVGGGQPAASGGSVADHVGVGDRVAAGEPGAAGDDAGRHGPGAG